MARKRSPDNPPPGAPAWMTTYGDLITLLLVFFVFLFSFSTIDAEKWQALLASLHGNVGVLEGGKTVSELPKVDDAALQDQIDEVVRQRTRRLQKSEQANEQTLETEEVDEFVRLFQVIEQYLEQNNIHAEIEISPEHTEILVRFQEYVLFDTGNADIKPRAADILDIIAQVLLEHIDAIDRIRVEGHTDNRPISTLLYPSNWELSADRAIKVVRFLQERHGIPGSKLAGKGFGEHQPIADNITEEGKAKNRRVDIQIARIVGVSGVIQAEGSN
jgi:chemotaxis protein MotB